jgi:protein arginine N-methyltransferase 5
MPTPYLFNRWFAEPIRTLFIPSTSFRQNTRGYPALTKDHQALLTVYTKLRPAPFILLSDTALASPSTSGGARHEPLSCLAYLRYLQKTQPPLSTVEKNGSGYQDYLQAPLQPLTDNLESITYEVFEKDPVKYDQYEKAIILALEARDAESNTLVALLSHTVTSCISHFLPGAFTICDHSSVR